MCPFNKQSFINVYKSTKCVLSTREYAIIAQIFKIIIMVPDIHSKCRIDVDFYYNGYYKYLIIMSTCYLIGNPLTLMNVIIVALLPMRKFWLRRHRWAFLVADNKN